MTTDANSIAGESVNSIITAFQGQNLESILRFLLILIVGFIVIRMAMKLVNRVLQKTHLLNDSFDAFIRSVVRFVLYFVLILAAASSIGIPITSFVALFSIVALAISLAIQGLLSNIAGSIIIMLTKPIRIDDFVQIGDVSGSVKAIGMMHTRLLSPDGKLIFMPNSSLHTSSVINFTVNGARRIDLPISASYGNSPDEVEKALMDALNVIRMNKDCGVLDTPAPAVHVDSYGDNAINYYLRVWTTTSKWFSTKMALNRELYAAFARNHVEMTYPHINVHMDK